VSAKGRLGGQHQGLYEKLQPMTKEIIAQSDKHGIYKVKWSIPGAKGAKPSTMIPDSWNINDFAKAIKEVYQNPIEIKPSGDKLIIHGKCSKGLPFRVVVEKILINGQVRDKLITAFPIHDSDLPACFK
jgi:Bacterial EndoU nuclease